MTAIAVQTASFLSRNKPLLYCIGAAVSLITMGAFHIMEDPYELGH